MDAKKVNGSANGKAGTKERREKGGVAGEVKGMASEGGAGGDVERWRDHGRHQRGPGKDRREGRRVRGDGAGTGALGHSQRGWRGTHGVYQSDSRDYGYGDNSGDGQGAHRTLCGGGCVAGAGSGFY